MSGLSRFSTQSDFLSAVRGFWVLWLGGTITQVKITPAQQEISKELFASSQAYLTRSAPDLDFRKAAHDAKIFSRVFDLLFIGFARGQIPLESSALPELERSSVRRTLLHTVDSNNENLLHYLARKKVTSLAQGLYLKEIAMKLGTISLMACHGSDQPSLTADRNNSGQTARELIVKMNLDRPEFVSYREHLLDQFIFFEAPTVLSLVPTLTDRASLVLTNIESEKIQAEIQEIYTHGLGARMDAKVAKFLAEMSKMNEKMRSMMGQPPLSTPFSRAAQEAAEGLRSRSKVDSEEASGKPD